MSRDGVYGSLRADGLRRTYLLYVPRMARHEQAMPLVIALHGGGGSAERMVGFTQGKFNALAEAEGFLVAYPEAVKYPLKKRNWNDGRNVASYPAQRTNVDDVGFIAALIDHLAVTYPVDRQRVYVTGASNGGIMSHRLGCELTEKFAAIAPVIGSIAAPLAPTCAPAGPISALMINGTADPLVPWNGGEVRFGPQRLGQVISIQATSAFWSQHNGCSSSPIVTYEPDQDPSDGTRVRRETYPGCQAGTEVVFYAVEGGGHTWPGGQQYASEAIIGKVSRDMDACELIWNFFKRHSRPLPAPQRASQ